MINEGEDDICQKYNGPQKNKKKDDIRLIIQQILENKDDICKKYSSPQKKVENEDDSGPSQIMEYKDDFSKIKNYDDICKNTEVLKKY